MKKSTALTYLAILILAAVMLLGAAWTQMRAAQDASYVPARVPAVEIEGAVYVITSVFEGSESCPEGFAYAGEAAVAGSDALRPCYTSPEHPAQVYIYQECRDRQTRESYTGYVRYDRETPGTSQELP